MKMDSNDKGTAVLLVVVFIGLSMLICSLGYLFSTIKP